MRALAVHASEIDTRPLVQEWGWLVPASHSPLLVGAFGDCIFGDPGGAHWNLSLLEGDYRRIAASSEEFKELKGQQANLDDWFNAAWVSMAIERGITPAIDECLGWKVHPVLGAPISIENIGVFSVRVYHSLTGQLFRQIKNGAQEATP